MKYTLTLDIEDINRIFETLEDEPFNCFAGVIADMRKQLTQQTNFDNLWREINRQWKECNDSYKTRCDVSALIAGAWRENCITGLEADRLRELSNMLFADFCHANSDKCAAIQILKQAVKEDA